MSYLSIRIMTVISVLVMQLWLHVPVAVGAIRFEDRFCTSKKGKIGGVGQA